jgi:3'-phosphoadenosine 5'-phosphosulfate sulfotransferase (PAPS reductase)/FAD synthetase
MKEFHNYPLKLRFHKKWLENKTVELCNNFIKNHNTLLALSFGKDSMTILHILSKYDLLNKLKLVMWNNAGFEAEETLRLRNYVLEKYIINNYEETFVDNYKEFFKKDLKENIQKKHTGVNFAYNVLEKPRWKIMDKYEINGTILGLRKEESKMRRINFYIRGESYYNKRELSDILQPIAKWTVIDIFSYAYSENIPIHPVYARSRKYELDFKKVRVNNLADINCYQYGRIHVNKLLYPNEYNKILNEFPEIRRLL